MGVLSLPLAIFLAAAAALGAPPAGTLVMEYICVTADQPRFVAPTEVGDLLMNIALAEHRRKYLVVTPDEVTGATLDVQQSNRHAHRHIDYRRKELQVKLRRS